MPLTIYYVLPPSRQRFVSSTEKMGVPFSLKVLPKTARSPQTVENLYSFFNVYYTWYKSLPEAKPPIYLHSDFAMPKFEVSSLINLFLVYFKLGFYRRQQAEKSKSNWGNKSNSSNWIFQTGKLQKSSADRWGESLWSQPLECYAHIFKTICIPLRMQIWHKNFTACALA